MKILYNFPSRERPTKLVLAIENIISLAKHDDYIILCTLDVDDKSCANIEFSKRLLSYDKVMPVYGFSKNKIDAVNRDIWMIENWDIMVTQSDDMVWVQEGFDIEIINDILVYAPDTDIFLHYPDGKQKSTSTLNIVGRKYYNRSNYVYHPDYCNVYCDNEETEKARLLDKYKFIDKNLFEHRHPIWRKTEWDEQYRRNESAESYEHDRNVFEKRRLINFGV